MSSLWVVLCPEIYHFRLLLLLFKFKALHLQHAPDTSHLPLESCLICKSLRAVYHKTFNKMPVCVEISGCSMGWAFGFSSCLQGSYMSLHLQLASVGEKALAVGILGNLKIFELAQGLWISSWILGTVSQLAWMATGPVNSLGLPSGHKHEFLKIHRALPFPNRKWITCMYRSK